MYSTVDTATNFVELILPHTKLEKLADDNELYHTSLDYPQSPYDMEYTINGEKKYIEVNNIEVDIEADGGINLKTAPQVKKAGANILVAGTAILMANNFKTIIDELKS